jgi:acetolactate synthase small subunit
MDEKTEELRDIFVDATGADSITESQEESRGSLSDAEPDIRRRVEKVVEQMRERYDFQTALTTAELRQVVMASFEDVDDETIATELAVDPETVFDARMDLHLVQEADRDAPFDLTELRRMLVRDASREECVEALGADEETISHFAEVIRAELEATRANNRFYDEFIELLTDTDLAAKHAKDAREDGLKEATEDIETDVSF